MPKRYDPTQMTIQFSMIVVITSWAPTVPLRKPGDSGEEGAGEHRAEDRHDDEQERTGKVDPLRKLRRDEDGGDRARRGTARDRRC